MEKEFGANKLSFSAEYKMNPAECPKVWLKSLLTLAESIMVQEYKMEPAECPRRWTLMSEIPCTQEYKMDPGPLPDHWVLEADPTIKKELLLARYEYLLKYAEAEVTMLKNMIEKLKKEL